LYHLLLQADPVTAAAIHPNNTKRVARALSFFQTTGQLFSDHNAAQKESGLLYDTAFIILQGDRSCLYERINSRVDDMLRQGLVDEVRGLLAKGYHPALTSMQGIGYKETIRYIHGECSLTQAADAVKQATRHYAKRQLTWFRHQAKIGHIINKEHKTTDEIVTEIRRKHVL
jgi:tRNA dimethylallyltransferase